MHELGGLFCKTAISGILDKITGREKNMIGLKLGKPNREKKIKKIEEGALGVGSPWALAHLQREAGGSGEGSWGGGRARLDRGEDDWAIPRRRGQ